MDFKPTKIDGAYILEPKMYEDDRGFFCETWNGKQFFDNNIPHVLMVQTNFSRSYKNVLRGLHYQSEHAQGKLVWVTHGEVYDVFVDLRENSPTFGMWDGYLLGGLTRLWVPPGLAHGFLVKTDYADFNYMVTDFRYPEFERTLKWNDTTLNIDWNLSDELPILSKKDENGVSFLECEKYS
jgi:dTDP-4-dehydrorhamnose 3,5-epimerase